MAKSHTMDLTQGSVTKNLIIFALPILFTNILQQLYQSADMVVVGRFAADGEASLAAVGSTGSITTLMLNIFLGLSVGANIICAKYFGAREGEKLKKTMETALIVAAVAGVAVGILGVLLSRTLLVHVMQVPDDIIDEATLYMQIVFLGQPGSLVYNFGAGILRAHGDTRRPMWILAISGMVNVLLNLLFVAVFHWDAAGVAAATSISNYLSAAMVLLVLFHREGEYGLRWKELRFHAAAFREICRIGIPCGFNGIVFSLSNVIISGAINSMGKLIIAANSAAFNIDALLFMIISAFYNAVTSFAGQNFGAHDFGRIKSLFWKGILVLNAVLLVGSALVNLFPEFFLGLFTEEAEVIAAAMPRIRMIAGTYCLYTVAEIAVGCLRGLGQSTGPTVLNIFCICVPRILWVLLVLPFNNTYSFLMICYPISWVICSVVQTVNFYRCHRREEKKYLDGLKASAIDGETVPANAR